MVDLSGLLGSQTGNVSGMIGGLGGLVKSLFTLILVGGLVAVITYYFANQKSYNKKIYIFEEINGNAVPTGMDKAREIVLPNTSMRVLFLKRRKLFLPRPSKQIGLNQYWYFIRKDGEWINIGLRNLNKELKELNIDYDHTDMRMSNASLKKLVEDNYKKTNWLKEYAPYIGMGILILLLGIVFYLLIDKTGKVLNVLGSSLKENSKLVETSRDLLKAVDNVCSGSGIR